MEEHKKDLCFMSLFREGFLVIRIPRFNEIVHDEELEKELVTIFNDKKNRNLHFERLREMILVDKIMVSDRVHLAACPKLGNQRKSKFLDIF